MKRRTDDVYLLQQARRLRRDQTGAEALLWYRLRRRQLGVRFRRQEPIGPFIVDFACLLERLVIEIDGDTHEDVETDTNRDLALTELGFKVLRFWNSEVYEDLDAVTECITRHLPPR